MNDTKKIIKDDINFLEYPNWIVGQRSPGQRFIMDKANGRYEVASIEGLPTHFDKVVLYYLLHKLFVQSDQDSLKVETTRYEIIKNVHLKPTKQYGSPEYKRIMLSLKKWKSIAITFEGIFYEGDGYTLRGFSIIDEYILRKGSNTLTVLFNASYIRQLKESKFYKLIDFEQYKRLSRCTSARLYEILIKNFKERRTWCITLQSLAEKLTLQKRTNAKHYYASDVLSKLEVAIHEINEKTEVKIEFSYTKSSDLCTFRNTVYTRAIKEQKRDAAYDTFVTHSQESLVPTVSIPAKSALLGLLESYGISATAAKRIAHEYETDKIKEKLTLLKTSKQAIKNVGAWLLAALKADTVIPAKTEKKTSALKKTIQSEKQFLKQVEDLKAQHERYKEVRVQELYDQLPVKMRKKLDEQFKEWLTERLEEARGFAAPESVYRHHFLVEALLDEEEQYFEKWAEAQGHVLNKGTNNFQLSIE